MQLYRMELYKICRRKIIWIGLSIVVLLVTCLLLQAYGMREELQKEFGLSAGYRSVMDIMQFGYMLFSFWLIVAFAPIFSEVNASSVKAMIHSSERGKEYAYWVKILAAFSLIFALFIGITAFIVIVIGGMYGFFYGEAKISGIYFGIMNHTSSLAETSISLYLRCYLFISFLAVLMLGTMVICISSYSRSVLQSFLASLAVYLIPVILETMQKRGSMELGYIFVTGQPILLTVHRCIKESWSAYSWHIVLIISVILVCLWLGLRRWKRIDKK